jgi:para-nitrobenzyl esterase
VPGTFGVFPRLYGPNVDGSVFPEQPLAAIRRGAHAHVPVIVGNATQETQQFVGGLGPVPDAASYEAAVRKVFGAPSDRVLATYPAAGYPTPRDALVRVTTDAFFTCQARRVGRVLGAAQPQPVYRYLFDHRLDNDPEQRALGAVHTVEHPFFFAWQGQYRPTETDLAVQRLVVGHWTTLARDGTLPTWAPAGDALLRISDHPQLTRDDEARCDFWDTVTLPWPHL